MEEGFAEGLWQSGNGSQDKSNKPIKSVEHHEEEGHDNQAC